MPARDLYLTKGDIYAPLIVVIGCSRELALQIGETGHGDCLIFQKFKPSICPIIHDRNNIQIKNSCVDHGTTQFMKLHFKIKVDDTFINGQNNVSVAFIDSTERKTYNTCGFIHFESQKTTDDENVEKDDDINNDNSTHCICTVNDSSSQTEVTEDLPQIDVVEHSSSVSNLLYIPHLYTTFLLIILLCICHHNKILL